MSDVPSDPAGALLSALAAQREAILSGRLAMLPDIAAALESAAAGLRTAQVSDRDLTEIRTTATRNAELLKASERGVRSVARRLRELRDPETPSRTYSSDGRSRAFGPVGENLGQRL